jgi:hypothetical protein
MATCLEPLLQSKCRSTIFLNKAVTLVLVASCVCEERNRSTAAKMATAPKKSIGETIGIPTSTNGLSNHYAPKAHLDLSPIASFR